MKKNLLLLGLAVAAMTSCTNDEVMSELQESPKAISFDSFVNKSTRATETTNAITKFYAYAYYADGNPASEVVFNGDAVTYDLNHTTSTKWSYGTEKYWTRNEYQFAGYANGNNADAVANVTFASGTLTIPSYTVDPDKNDLIADVQAISNAAGKASSSTVDFDFKHLLTKVKFKIQNRSQMYNMRITDLVVDGALQTGTCAVTSSSIAWGSRTAEKQYTPIANNQTGDYITIDDGNDAEGTDQKESVEFFVLPQELANVKFTITANFYDANDQIVATKEFTEQPFADKKNENSAVVSEWAPGTSYVYTLQLPVAAKPIVFGTPGIAEWTPGGTIELNPGGTGGTTTN